MLPFGMVAPETVTIFVFLMTYVCAHKVVAESINTIKRRTKNVLVLITWWLRPVGLAFAPLITWWLRPVGLAFAPLITWWLRPVGLAFAPLITWWLRPVGLAFAPLITWWLRPVGLAFAPLIAVMLLEDDSSDPRRDRSRSDLRSWSSRQQCTN